MAGILPIEASRLFFFCFSIVASIDSEVFFSLLGRRGLFLGRLALFFLLHGTASPPGRSGPHIVLFFFFFFFKSFPSSAFLGVPSRFFFLRFPVRTVFSFFSFTRSQCESPSFGSPWRAACVSFCEEGAFSCVFVLSRLCEPLPLSNLTPTTPLLSPFTVLEFNCLCFFFFFIAVLLDARWHELFRWPRSLTPSVVESLFKPVFYIFLYFTHSGVLVLILLYLAHPFLNKRRPNGLFGKRLADNPWRPVGECFPPYFFHLMTPLPFPDPSNGGRSRI